MVYLFVLSGFLITLLLVHFSFKWDLFRPIEKLSKKQRVVVCSIIILASIAFSFHEYSVQLSSLLFGAD